MRRYIMDNRNMLRNEANKLLDQNLGAGELVQVIILGLWDSAIIGTKNRAFIFKKGMMGGVMFGSKLTSWDYRNLTGVQLETGPMSGFVSLQGPGISSQDLSYWDTGKNSPAMSPHAISLNRELFPQAREGVACLRELIMEAQRSRDGETNVPDIPGQIRGLATLHDQGIITQEEFESKKKDLLKRM